MPFHYQYLIYITGTRFDGNLSLRIEYLLKRYLVYLCKISLTSNKKREQQLINHEQKTIL